MKNAVVGFPRVGKLRELKFASEKYFRGDITKEELTKTAKEIKAENWKRQKEEGIDFISSNDFSYYDGMLDTAVLLGAVPQCYKALQLDELDTYFAMARGYQGEHGDVAALAMKKWFNTNYHYIVPELGADTNIHLAGTKVFEEYKEAKDLGVTTKPVLIGPFTFLKLARYQDGKKAEDFAEDIINVYCEILAKFAEQKAEWVQIDEPALVCDLTKEDIAFFEKLYKAILAAKGTVKVLLQTYFGDVRDSYDRLIKLEFDGIGLDFLEGRKTLELVQKFGFPEDKILFAGLVNGKNIWKCDYEKVVSKLEEIKKYAKEIVLATSCSLLHVPYTLQNESKLDENINQHFSFAVEKLKELRELSALENADDYTQEQAYQENQNVVKKERCYQDAKVRETAASLPEDMFTRTPARTEREKIQKEVFQFPEFPTTTIGSFPQTQEVKKNRSSYKKGEIDKAAYDKQVYAFIDECIKQQEEIGLDVLVHGEYERNDMVEFFGENLAGYVFTEKAGIRVIQIDEAALKEKLPIRKSDWYSEYLDWAIPAFRLCHSGVKPETQIHTHMCYSEFDEIIKDIDNMDADVISFEASRSKLTILDAIQASQFETEVGPGVYDIHSPRIPSVEEIKTALENMLEKISPDKLWVNPDCGLKTRGMKETLPSLKNMVQAAEEIRKEKLV